MEQSSEPIELRPRVTPDGRVDVASVRWTIQHMHSELAENADMARVRNALAIALLEIDSVRHQKVAPLSSSAALSRYLPWPRKL